MRGIAWLAEKLLASQEELWSLESATLSLKIGGACSTPKKNKNCDPLFYSK